MKKNRCKLLLIFLFFLTITSSILGEKSRSGADVHFSTDYSYHTSSPLNKIPYSYGIHFGATQSLDAFFKSHKLTIPFIQFETGYTNYSSSTLTLSNIPFSLGPVWKIPLGLKKLNGRLVAGLLPGLSIMNLDAKSYTNSRSAAFIVHSLLGYEINLKILNIFLLNKIQYYYDKNSPLLGIGFNLGVSYKIY